MQFNKNDVDMLIENCERNKAGLENVKPYEDIQPKTDLLSIAIAALGNYEDRIGGKDEW